ncbi:MAG: hypothetical protein ACT4NV_16565 [Rhodoferax sp.]
MRMSVNPKALVLGAAAVAAGVLWSGWSGGLGGAFFAAPRSAAPTSPAAPQGPCGDSTGASPFAAPTPCAAPGPVAVAPAKLAELKQALDAVDPCAGQRRDCRRAAPAQEKMLVKQLEDLAVKAPTARVTLALQLQRQREREGLHLEDAHQRNLDTELQRSVALLAEAVAAGDAQALRIRDALGPQGARLLHTGR